MIESNRILLPLLDFEWCDYDRITLSRNNVAENIIREYLHCVEFQTSFIGPTLKVEPEFHGPFLRTKIHESDFELISLQQFKDEIESIHYLDDCWIVPDEKWQPLEKLVSRICSRNCWFFKLRLTEKDKECFHEVGWILGLFREFICASPNSEIVERLVFGWD